MFTVVGYRDVDFIDDKGRRVQGTSVYYTSDEGKNVVGEEVGKFFLTFKISNDCNYLPTVGDQLKLYYNRFGKVASVVRVEKKK